MSPKPFEIGIAHDRHHQAAVRGDGDADVVVLVVDDVGAVHRGVDHREFLQRLDGGLHEERHEAELHAVLLSRTGPCSARAAPARRRGRLR